MPLNLTRTTDATVEPVNADEFRTHVRWEHGNVEEALMQSFIKAARRHIEDAIGRAMIDQTWTLKLDCFPPVIEVPRPPLSSITSFQYIDTDGDTQTVDASIFDTDTTSAPGRIFEAFNQTWPNARVERNAITLVYVAGYGPAASDVPEQLKVATKLLAAHWFRNRETTAPMTQQDIPHGVDALISPFSVFITGA